jgi:hypothetical protein
MIFYEIRILFVLLQEEGGNLDETIIEEIKCVSVL